MRINYELYSEDVLICRSHSYEVLRRKAKYYVDWKIYKVIKSAPTQTANSMKITYEDINRAVEMKSMGMTWVSIAKRLGCSPAGITKVVRELYPKSPVTQVDRKCIPFMFRPKNVK